MTATHPTDIGNPIVIGIDAGGTMTDTILVDANGHFKIGKAATTPRDESEGFIISAADAADAWGIPLGDLFSGIDVVLYAVKTYDNASALPRLAPLVGDGTSVLTVQTGVDSVAEVSREAGEAHTLGGTTYIAPALDAPGLSVPTGHPRRIVFGEWFHPADFISSRVDAIARALQTADIQVEPVADARVPIWEKFVYLAPFAAFTGAARLPTGPIAADPASRPAFLQAVAEVDAVARASGIPIAADTRARIEKYLDDLPASTRSSLLIDLSLGKRIEIETLAGLVVRRGRALRVATPMMCALYAVLRPWADPRT